MRKAVQIIAGILLVVVLAFPPFKFVVAGEHASYEGFLGYYLLIHPPDNPIEVMQKIHEQRAKDGTQPLAFNHATDSIRAEIDPLPLLAELFGIIITAGILTAILDRRRIATK